MRLLKKDETLKINSSFLFLLICSRERKSTKFPNFHVSFFTSDIFEKKLENESIFTLDFENDFDKKENEYNYCHVDGDVLFW